MKDSPAPVAHLIDAFRRGDDGAGNELLRRYRPWLEFLARGHLRSSLRSKFDASDVVQQAMMEVLRAFPRFRGTTEAEWTAWVRRILARVLAHEVRRYRGTRKRDVSHELSIDQELAHSSHRLGAVLAASGTSPSQGAMKREQEVRVAELLDRMPDDYREVISLRHLEDLPFEAIGERMNRSAGAVRMLWVRALGRLRQEMGRMEETG